MALDYLFQLYSIIFGLTVFTYVQKWGEFLQIRRFSIYSNVPLLWSFCFLSLLINTWFYGLIPLKGTTPGLFFIHLWIPFSYYLIATVMFPNTARLNPKDKHAYLDYYEHFRKNKTLVMSLALIAITTEFISLWFPISTDKNIGPTFLEFLSSQNTYIFYTAFIAAIFIDNKGYVFLLGLVIFYLSFSRFSSLLSLVYTG